MRQLFVRRVGGKDWVVLLVGGGVVVVDLHLVGVIFGLLWF